MRIDIITYCVDDIVTAVTVYSWSDALDMIARTPCTVVTVRATPKGRIVVTLE